jgi:ethanolamine ammonia-lyase small subunit
LSGSFRSGLITRRNLYRANARRFDRDRWQLRHQLGRRFRERHESRLRDRDIRDDEGTAAVSDSADARPDVSKERLRRVVEDVL